MPNANWYQKKSNAEILRYWIGEMEGRSVEMDLWAVSPSEADKEHPDVPPVIEENAFDCPLVHFAHSCVDEWGEVWHGYWRLALNAGVTKGDVLAWLNAQPREKTTLSDLYAE